MFLGPKKALFTNERHNKWDTTTTKHKKIIHKWETQLQLGKLHSLGWGKLNINNQIHESLSEHLYNSNMAD